MTSNEEGLPQPEGLRARKQRQTREKICKVTLRLLLERGFEGTTLDAIAEAADVSRRSLFHYFESKEAIVQALESGDLDVLSSVIVASPASVAPLDSIYRAFLQIVERYETKEAMQINCLMRSNEALRARKQANYARQEQVVFAALCEKWPGVKRRLRLRLIAMAGVGALRVASERWTDEDMKRPLTVHLKEAFDGLRAELTGK